MALVFQQTFFVERQQFQGKLPRQWRYFVKGVFLEKILAGIVVIFRVVLNM